MINISGITATPESIMSQQTVGKIGKIIIDKLALSTKVYYYTAINELKFELDLRDSIIKAARELHRARFSFRTFRNSLCNADYWDRTKEGGFLLKAGVKPVDAVRDIYSNGYKYGSECATAIVIVYYKALADIVPEERYNELFSDIYLMNWKKLDRNIGVTYYDRVEDFLPGDCRYFKNPDVDPLTPWWQGENAIDLGDGTYYGHGIGITDAEGIIDSLNRYRKSGSSQSAYLLNSVTRLNPSV